jgi:ABC-type Na+ efflux pump permease subunit
MLKAITKSWQWIVAVLAGVVGLVLLALGKSTKKVNEDIKKEVADLTDDYTEAVEAKGAADTAAAITTAKDVLESADTHIEEYANGSPNDVADWARPNHHHRS